VTVDWRIENPVLLVRAGVRILVWTLPDGRRIFYGVGP
jgi:hypothetical protein